MNFKLPKNINIPKVNIYWLFVLLLLSLALFNFSLSSHLEKSSQKVLGVKISIREDELKIAFWDKFLEDNPKYFPGLVEQAKLQLKLGKKDEYDQTIERIRSLGPNSPFLKYLD